MIYRYCSTFIIYDVGIGGFMNKESVVKIYNSTPLFSNDYSKILLKSIQYEVSFNITYSEDYIHSYFQFEDIKSLDNFDFEYYKNIREEFLERQRFSEIYKFCRFYIIDSQNKTVDNTDNSYLLLNTVGDDRSEDQEPETSNSWWCCLD